MLLCWFSPHQLVSERGMTLDVDQGPGLLLHQSLTSIGVLDAWGRPCMKLGCRRRSKPPPTGNLTGEPTHPSANNPSRSTCAVDLSSCHCLSSPPEQPRRRPRHSRQQQASTSLLRKSGSAFVPTHDHSLLALVASLLSIKRHSASALVCDPNPQFSIRACSIYTHQSPSTANSSSTNRQQQFDLYRWQPDISNNLDLLPASPLHPAMPSPAPLRAVFQPHTSTSVHSPAAFEESDSVGMELQLRICGLTALPADGNKAVRVPDSAMDGNYSQLQAWMESNNRWTVLSSDWHSQLPPYARQRIVNKIMDTLKRHLPVNDPEGITEIMKIAQRFEEKIYAAAANQSEYLRKISLKMLSMEAKT